MAKVPEPATRKNRQSTGEVSPARPPFREQLNTLTEQLSNNKTLGRIILGLAFALLVLQLLEFPHHTYDTTHDLSSHATFEYYAAKKFQFGTEVYQNVGPYGFVHYAYSYIGYLHAEKVILKTVSRLILVVLILWMCGGLKNAGVKFCWWAGFFLFFPLGNQTHEDYLDVDENYAYLTVYVTALWLLQNRRDRRFYLISAGLWFFLAFTSLTKHTCFVLACSVVAVVVGQNIVRRNFRSALLGALAFSGSLFVHWLIAGQKLANLPTFVRGIFAFSGGYNEAMAVNEPLKMTLLGLGVVLILGARSFLNWWHEKREWGRSALEAFLLYVIWKHSFVRADTIHMMILFYAGLLFAIPFCYYRTNHIRDSVSEEVLQPPFLKKIDLGWCLGIIIFCFVSTYVIVPNSSYQPQRLGNNLRQNLSWIIHPVQRTREMQELLQKSKEDNALPQVKAAVGNARIDFFGYRPGYILLNDLNYWPRPMPITFAAANPLLQKANETFYRQRDTAPEFVLYGAGGVDDRLFIQDDALAFRALLDNYHPLFVEKGLMLLQRKSAEEWVAQRTEQFVGEQIVKFDQFISFPNANGRMLWMETQVEHNGAGRLMSFLYKAPPAYVGFQFPGEQNLRFAKFVTAMGPCGLIINPILEDPVDIANVYDPEVMAEPFPPFAGMTFVRDSRDKKFFKDEIRLRFYLVDRPRP